MSRRAAITGAAHANKLEPGILQKPFDEPVDGFFGHVVAVLRVLREGEYSLAQRDPVKLELVGHGAEVSA